MRKEDEEGTVLAKLHNRSLYFDGVFTATQIQEVEAG